MSAAEKKGNITNNSPGSSQQQSTDTNVQGQEQVPQAASNDIKKEKKDDVDLIDLINDLQSKLVASGRTLDVSLPQIVVVGSQSAGKSSVLEGFVGREFLPRGKDTVTRRPTYVQMIRDPYEEYAIFAHKPDVKFTDFSKVREEIEAETRRHPGPQGFSPDPINLKIYSPRVLKLTVVDLPGLIKNVEDGHDVTNISQVRSMVLEYIRPKEALILAVTPATQEIVTSDALEIAKEVDPSRERTIGVITKVDALSDGTDCRDVLENKKIYLKKGYVGVVNRNQKEIEEHKDFPFIIQKERDFFAHHPAYRHMKHVMGTPYLKKMLQKTLRAHIKQFLPQMRSDLSNQLSEHQKQLRSFEKKMGDGLGLGRLYGKQYYVVRLIQNFIDKIYIEVFGNSEMVDINKISAGAFIHYKFATEVRKNLNLTMIPDENKTSIIILNMLGMRTHIALPATALEALNRILLEQYKLPMEESVNCIKKILEYAVSDSAKIMDRYSTLKAEILFRISVCIDKEAENTIDRLLAHIDANKFYINYSHPDFDSTVCNPVAPPVGPIKLWENASAEEDSAAEVIEGENPNPAIPSTEKMMNLLKQNESNQQNVKYSSTLLMKILEQVQKQMGDVAVKYIAFFLVKKVIDFIKNELLPTLLESTNFATLTEDCEADFRWKEETEMTCKILKEALEAIQDF